MPKRSSEEERLAEIEQPLKPDAEIAKSMAEQNSPEEDALERIARAVERKSDTARKASVRPDVDTEFERLLAEFASRKTSVMADLDAELDRLLAEFATS